MADARTSIPTWMLGGFFAAAIVGGGSAVYSAYRPEPAEAAQVDLSPVRELARKVEKMDGKIDGLVQATADIKRELAVTQQTKADRSEVQALAAEIRLLSATKADKKVK